MANIKKRNKLALEAKNKEWMRDWSRVLEAADSLGSLDEANSQTLDVDKININAFHHGLSPVRSRAAIVQNNINHS